MSGREAYTSIVTAADEADMEMNNSYEEGVGFESTTLLAHAPGNNARDSASGGVTAGVLHPGGSSSPFALYEPRHAQPGVLGALPSRSYADADTAAQPVQGSGESVGILGAAPPASAPVLPPQQQQQQQQQRMVSSLAYVEEGLDVPLHAPRLRVPTDLPLEQTTLIDLLAMMVVQGGPTTEEEIVKREVTRRNPAFAFLGEKFNHPCLLYYRWRLYSLLQQDSLLSWRTAPFQVEQARRAYVFVPPPAMRVGPECLACLHHPEALKVTASGGGGESRAEDEDGEKGNDDGDEIAVRRTAHRRHRRRHRHRHHRNRRSLSDRHGSLHKRHKTETEKEEAEDDDGGIEGRGALTNEDSVKTDSKDERRAGAERSGSSSSSSSSSDSSSDSDAEDTEGEAHKENVPFEEHPSSPPSSALPHGDAIVEDSKLPTDPPSQDTEEPQVPPLPPPSAQWISRQCILNKHIFTVLQPELVVEWTQLLNPRRICPPSACNSMAELCATWLSRDEIGRRMVFAVQHADGIHHLLSILLDAMVRVAYVATAQSRAPLPPPPPPSSTTATSNAPQTPAQSLDSNVFCVEALFLLFVLHDVLMNASNMPSTSSPCCVNKNVRTATTAASLSSSSSSSSPALSSGFNDDTDDAMTALENNSSEALESLYVEWKLQQQQQQQRGGGSGDTPTSKLSTAATTPTSSSSSSPAPHAPTFLPQPLPSAVRHRRRPRTTRRRSPYERCGDALELILPTLLEACTAIALAVSLDKERQPVVAATPTRVHHFKVLPQTQSRRQQQKKNAGEGKPTAAAAPAAVGAQKPATSSSPPPVGAAGGAAAGASLSLRLDAGCRAASPSEASTTPAESPSSPSGAADGADTTTPNDPSSLSSSSSSAPAVMLLEWVKALVLVWMNVEQPLQLPAPSPQRHTATGAEDAAPPPSDLLWPDTKAGAADTADVRLAYYVKASQAHVLGLEATTAATPGPQFFAGEPRQPPLLSARACAILKERYSYLL